MARLWLAHGLRSIPDARLRMEQWVQLQQRGGGAAAPAAAGRRRRRRPLGSGSDLSGSELSGEEEEGSGGEEAGGAEGGGMDGEGNEGGSGSEGDGRGGARRWAAGRLPLTFDQKQVVGLRCAALTPWPRFRLWAPPDGPARSWSPAPS